MSIGMTYQEFWYEDVELAQFYLESHKILQEREAEKMKWTVWYQGLHIFEALCDVSPILRPFSKAKKPLQYPSQPIGMEEKKDEKREEKQKEVDLARAQIFFRNWARSTQKNFKGE